MVVEFQSDLPHLLTAYREHISSYCSQYAPNDLLNVGVNESIRSLATMVKAARGDKAAVLRT